MAKYHYRVYGSARWQSSSGNAIIAIINKPRSAKRVDINSFEIYPLTQYKGGVYLWVLAVRSTQVKGGTPVPLIKLDPNAPDPPGEIRVVAFGSPDIGELMSRTEPLKFDPYPAMQSFCSTMNSGRLDGAPRGARVYYRVSNPMGLEALRLRPGEGISLIPSTCYQSFPIEAEAIFTLDFTPPRTYIARCESMILDWSTAILTILNGAGSGRVLTIKQVIFGEKGTFDTPYFMLVPVGLVNPDAMADPECALSYIKMDTAAPDIPTRVLSLYRDVPILPKGVPAAYIAEGSAGNPKYQNYLQTRDLIGPVWQTFFPEVRDTTLAYMPDNLGKSAKYCRIKSGITLRSGDGLAVVSAAETATGGQVGSAGWTCIDFGINFSIEDDCPVTVKLIDGQGNPIPGASVLVRRTSDNFVVLSGTTGSNGIISGMYDYTGDVEVNIRARKSSPGDTRYFPVETIGTITYAGLSVTLIMEEDWILA